ncbi:hypothetical protein PISMIDRAFT_221779 [Pisolithus microcarpus 441]|uniref:Unplaced genomic scaffold scaffold_14, whole genome shotgun sequence n=1 Tax=Pisolithus microcarpus 441 TaxID=765257 RepID=A0A0C9YPY0_9AGAM|nr:hypothetical protein PISMIDRAFT_221779 [Pisolithus microcarpus 441]
MRTTRRKIEIGRHCGQEGRRAFAKELFNAETKDPAGLGTYLIRSLVSLDKECNGLWFSKFQDVCYCVVHSPVEYGRSIGAL